MSKKETRHKIFVTTDHTIFKRLEGNRSVSEARVKKIINSIKKVGYIPGPIIVNERFEVIDGQGRLEAAKRLELPIYFMIINGIGMDECIAMNINQTPWTIRDYIECYAEAGNISYINLLNLINEFKDIQQKVILCATTGKTENSTREIKEEEFQCTMDDYSQARKTLRKLMRYKPILNRVSGHSEYYYMSLMFCFGDPEVDEEQLYKNMTRLQADLIPISTPIQAFEKIEEIYNYRSRRNHVYITTNYRRYLDGKYKWYASRYWKDKED